MQELIRGQKKGEDLSAYIIKWQENAGVAQRMESEERSLGQTSTRGT